jgi:hypothetical protein
MAEITNQHSRRLVLLGAGPALRIDVRRCLLIGSMINSPHCINAVRGILFPVIRPSAGVA